MFFCKVKNFELPKDILSKGKKNEGGGGAYSPPWWVKGLNLNIYFQQSIDLYLILLNFALIYTQSGFDIKVFSCR